MGIEWKLLDNNKQDLNPPVSADTEDFSVDIPENTGTNPVTYYVTYNNTDTGCYAEKTITVPACPSPGVNVSSVNNICAWAIPDVGLTVNIANPINGGQIVYEITNNGETLTSGTISMTDSTTYTEIAKDHWGSLSNDNKFKWHLQSDSSITGETSFSTNTCTEYKAIAWWETNESYLSELKNDSDMYAVWITKNNSVDFDIVMTLSSWVEKFVDGEWKDSYNGKYKLHSIESVSYNFEGYNFDGDDGSTSSCLTGSSHSTKTKTMDDVTHVGNEYRFEIDGGYIALISKSETDFEEDNISIKFYQTSFNEPDVGIQDVRITFKVEFIHGGISDLIEFEWGEKFCGYSETVSCDCLNSMKNQNKLPSPGAMTWDGNDWVYDSDCQI